MSRSPVAVRQNGIGKNLKEKTPWQGLGVAGATGRVGRHVVDVLQAGGHDVMAISRSHGVDVITGDGLSALDHAPTRCRALGGIVAHLDRHFRARAAAERFHLPCPLSGDALRPGLRYLQVTDRRTSMTLAPPASPIRKGERS